MAVRRKMIRQLVEQLLTTIGSVGPPVNIEKVASVCGLQVRKQDITNSDISGFILRTGNEGVIGVNSFHAHVRQRFTIAHEIGHYLIHSQGADEVHVDRKFDVRFRNSLSSEGVDKDEREANFFAAELLMPIHFIEEDLSKNNRMDIVDEDFIGELANKYEVSLQAMIFRLANLGFIRL